jgi:hypothetical protein
LNVAGESGAARNRADFLTTVFMTRKQWSRLQKRASALYRRRRFKKMTFRDVAEFVRITA